MKLNRTRLIVLRIEMMAAFGMTLYPPWSRKTNVGGVAYPTYKYVEYDWVFSSGRGKVDIPRLVLQWIVVGGLALLVLLLTMGRDTSGGGDTSGTADRPNKD